MVVIRMLCRITVFRCAQNCVSVADRSRTDNGSEFRSVGPEKAKHLWPYLVLERGTARSPLYSQVFTVHGVALIAIFVAVKSGTSLHCETTHTGQCIAWCACLLPSAYCLSHCAYTEDRAKLTWVARYITQWFACWQTVTNPSTNKARHTRDAEFRSFCGIPTPGKILDPAGLRLHTPATYSEYVDVFLTLSQLVWRSSQHMENLGVHKRS